MGDTMIRSFKDSDVERLFRRHEPSKRLEPYAKAALRKLDMLDVVDRIEKLFVPPGNKLKKIGDVWQIRINERYRIRFTWDGQDAFNVEIGDFH